MLTAPHEDTIPSSALVNVPTYLRKDVRPRDIESTGPDSSRVSVNLDLCLFLIIMPAHTG
jgi:hypothetical protein